MDAKLGRTGDLPEGEITDDLPDSKIYDLPEGGWEGWHTDDKGEEHDAEEDGHEERQHGAGALTLPRHGHVGGGGTGIVAHTAAVIVLLQINNIIFHFNSIIILQYKVMKCII